MTAGGRRPGGATSSRRTPRRGGGTGPRARPRRPVAAGQLQVADAGQAGPGAGEPLGRLHGRRVGTAAPVVVEVDGALAVQGDHPLSGIGPDPAEVVAAGQADQVAGEAVAADVRALPDQLPVRGGEGQGQGPPVGGAAAVVAAVGADQVVRLGDRLADL